MDPLDDVQIDSGLNKPGPDEPPATRPASTVGIAVFVIGAVLALIAAWYFWYQRPAQVTAPSDAPQPAAKAATETRAPLGPAVAAVELPPLFLTDPLVRDLIGRLSSRPEIMAWLAIDGLIRNLVVCIDNVASGQSPARHLPRFAPKTPFQAIERGGAFVMDPASAARYNGIADAVASLDPAGLARAYSTLKPRMIDAYRDLGHPEGDLDAATERALTLLIQTPVTDGDIALTEKVISYKFQREDVEALEPAQKHLLRMGTRNARIIQQHLRAIARELGIPDRRAPAGPAASAASAVSAVSAQPAVR
jgi:hypothetical protein